MCVIIFIPKDNGITKKELRKAWNVNSHGGGYCYQKDGNVVFKRGIMKYKDYENEIMDLIGKYDLILHMRITTSKVINKVQCHPYKIDNVKQLEGITKSPVVCMNGSIKQQKIIKECNDTMSYIIENYDTFNIMTQDILNLIQDSTHCRWAFMSPKQILLSSDFIEHEGRLYSNKRHLQNRMLIKKDGINYWYYYD